MWTGQDGPAPAGPRASGTDSAQRSRTSPTSIAPVGLELAGERSGHERLEGSKEEAQQTGPFRIPAQRRRLGGVVVGAVAGCALILVAAIIARVSHASNAPPTTANVAPGHLASTPTTAAVEAKQAQATGASLAANLPPISNPTAEASTNGTVRLERPAIAGRVWIDGKKVTSTSALVGCGTHLIKIGARGRARSVEIPCGGEIVISK